MTLGQKVTIWAAAIGGAGAILAALLPPMIQHLSTQAPIILYGAIMKADADPSKWFPIPDVEVSDEEGLIEKGTISDIHGGFALYLKTIAKMGQSITLKLRKEGYDPTNIREAIGDKLYTEYLAPVRPAAKAREGVRFLRVADTSEEILAIDIVMRNAKPVSKTITVTNRGNVRCGKNDTCSPDGKWKAAVRSVELEAHGNGTLRNAQVACIAGPCPFTHTDASGTMGKRISFSVTDWSETATFTAQATETDEDSAEHVHVSITGQTFMVGHNFEPFSATLAVQLANRTEIVEEFSPVGDVRDLRQHSLNLKLATCNQFRFNGSGGYIFNCKLNAGYQFGSHVLEYPQYRTPP